MQTILSFLSQLIRMKLTMMAPYNPQIISSASTQNVEVDVLAVTDQVTLTFNDGTDTKDITINEDSTIDMKNILVEALGIEMIQKVILM